MLPESFVSPDAQLAAIVESSDDAIIAKTLQGIITHWNPAATRLFGYSAEEAIGQHISLLALPGRAQEMADIVARIVAGEKVEHFVTERRAKDGRVLTISLSVSPIRRADGTIVGASKIVRDITDAQAALRQQALLAAIVDSSNDAIIATDLDGIVTNWNPAAANLFGYSAAEAVGAPVRILAAQGREAEMTRILARIRDGERLDHFETQRRHKNGTVLDISLTVSPIVDGSGRIIGASKIARDITEQKRNEARLQLMAAELDHRTKNVLAVAQSMLRLSRADTVAAFVGVVEGRIGALAKVHARVAENRWDGAELMAMARRDLAPFSPPGRMHVDGPVVFLRPAAAQVVAIVLHELATNAAKHGAFAAPAGRVDLGWKIGESGDLVLSWRESGVPSVIRPERASFGASVIERNVPEQLAGTSTLTWHEDGLEAVFTVPGDAFYAGSAPARPAASGAPEDQAGEPAGEDG